MTITLDRPIAADIRTREAAKLRRVVKALVIQQAHITPLLQVSSSEVIQSDPFVVNRLALIDGCFDQAIEALNELCTHINPEKYLDPEHAGSSLPL